MWIYEYSKFDRSGFLPVGPYKSREEGRQVRKPRSQHKAEVREIIIGPDRMRPGARLFYVRFSPNLLAEPYCARGFPPHFHRRGGKNFCGFLRRRSIPQKPPFLHRRGPARSTAYFSQSAALNRVFHKSTGPISTTGKYFFRIFSINRKSRDAV